jgi:hypothetical protein
MGTPLAIRDRAAYGFIAAAFGVLLGLGASLCLFFAFHSSIPVRWIVLASAIYFFIIGAVRGADAAFFTAEAITVVAGAALVETGVAPETGGRSDSRWASWSSPVLLMVWLAIVGVLAWRG